MNLSNMIYDDELDLYYDPVEGRLWHLQEKPIYRYNANSERYCSTETTRSTPAGSIRTSTTHFVWKIMTGEWPRQGFVIDHIDGDPRNNSWENLREATISQNSVNKQPRGRLRDDCNHLVPGVVRTSPQKYRVRLKINGKLQDFGSFDSAEEANAFATAKRHEVHGEFIRK